MVMPTKRGAEVEDAKRKLLEHLGREVDDPRVIEAMERVPREAFVPEASRDLAYEDIPVPIGNEQTISQPYVVALMLAALALKRTDTVLEIGTGSGYQTALLAELASEVTSVERIPHLADSARERLASLGYSRVRVELAVRKLGWETGAPYDGIIVAAGAPKLPHGLMEQLGVGGRLVVPVGSHGSQDLMKVSRSADAFSVETLGSCRFVPLIGDGAWPETENQA